MSDTCLQYSAALANPFWETPTRTRIRISVNAPWCLLSRCDYCVVSDLRSRKLRSFTQWTLQIHQWTSDKIEGAQRPCWHGLARRALSGDFLLPFACHIFSHWAMPIPSLHFRREEAIKRFSKDIQCKSKTSPWGYLNFFHFFHKRLRIFNRFFTHLLYVPMYARLQTFIQLPPTLTKLCHIKYDYLVHIICAKCPKHAKTRAFRRLRKSLIALLIVVCGKSL